MKQILIKINEGENVVENLTKEIKNRNIKTGIIPIVIGALKEFEIITIYKNSQKIPPEHFPTKYIENVELTGNGRIENFIPHLHVTLGREKGKALSGHLVEGIATYFVEVVILTE